jgi:hypothetical protein
MPIPRTKAASGVVKLTSVLSPIAVLSKVYYLATLSLSRLYSVDDGMINKYGEVGGTRTGRENRSTRRTPAPVPLYPPHFPRDLTWDWTWVAAVGSRRLTPVHCYINPINTTCFSL